MFTNKGRLKVSLLVIGGLVVCLGMYAGFQPERAEADSGWLSYEEPGHKYKWKNMSRIRSVALARIVVVRPQSIEPASERSAGM